MGKQLDCLFFPLLTITRLSQKAVRLSLVILSVNGRKPWICNQLEALWKLPRGPEFWRFPSTAALEVTQSCQHDSGSGLQICPCSFPPSAKGKSHLLLISSL